jgi:polyhydroxyalkanoate synthase
VYLLEWLPPAHGDGNDGLEEYADHAISEAAARISSETRGTKPFLLGHSLGGTFAAIFGALDPQSVRGLVLLGGTSLLPAGDEPVPGRHRLHGPINTVRDRYRSRLTSLSAQYLGLS